MARGADVTESELRKLRELHGAGLSRNQVAAAMDRAPSAISRWADRLGLVWGQRIENAAQMIQAATIDQQAQRTQLAEELLAVARRQLLDIEDEYRVTQLGMDKGESRWMSKVLDQPEAMERKALMDLVTKAATTAMTLAKFDADESVGTGQARGLLFALSDAAATLSANIQGEVIVDGGQPPEQPAE